MIHVVAQIQVAEGRRDAFLEEFHRLVPEVLQEKGCIEYGPTIDAVTDLERQQTDGNIVTILEKWDSLGDLKAHLVAPHMESYRERVKDLVVGAKLHVLEPA